MKEAKARAYNVANYLDSGQVMYLKELEIDEETGWFPVWIPESKDAFEVEDLKTAKQYVDAIRAKFPNLNTWVRSVIEMIPNRLEMYKDYDRAMRGI